MNNLAIYKHKRYNNHARFLVFYHKKESGGSGKPEKNRENDLQMYHRSLLKAHSLALFPMK